MKVPLWYITTKPDKAFSIRDFTVYIVVLSLSQRQKTKEFTIS